MKRRRWLFAGAALLGLAMVAYLGRSYLIAPPIPRPALDDVDQALREAIEVRIAAVEKDPRSAEAWGRLGIIYDIHDFPDAAIDCYSTARARDPEDFHWPYYTGICTSIGDQTASLEHFVAAARLNPYYAPLQVYVGRGYLLAERYPEAEAAFRAALNLDAKLVRAHVGLAKIALAANDAQEAQRHLQEAEQLGASAAEFHRLAAETARRLGNSEDAQRHDRLTVGKASFDPLPDPDRDGLGLRDGLSLRWRRARSEVHLAAGQADLAIQEWQQALAGARQPEQVHLELGEVYLRSQRADEAIEQLDKALTLRPGLARAQLHLGNARLQKGDGVGARAAFQAALEIDPELHEARGNLGALALAAGQTAEGLAQLRQCASALPGSADAQFNLAMALIQTEHSDQALEPLANAVALNPRLARAQFEYGLLLARAERFTEAASAFQAVVALDPARTGAHVNLIRALQATGQYRQAVAAQRFALEHNADHVKLRAGLAWLLATAPDPEARGGAEAVTIMNEIVGKPGGLTPRHLEILAAAHAEAGDFTQAERLGSMAFEQAKLMADQVPSEPAFALARRLGEQVELYRNEKPYRISKE